MALPIPKHSQIEKEKPGKAGLFTDQGQPEIA
jgi:hypothetical protein